MRKLLSLLVSLLFAFSTLALAGCDEEAEYWDEDTDSEFDPEPEPNTDISPGPDDDGEPVNAAGGGWEGKFKVSKGF